MSRQVKCPHCGKLTTYSAENKFRPFCSDRCQLIDLGAWADEKFAIPAEDATPPEDQAQEKHAHQMENREIEHPSHERSDDE